MSTMVALLRTVTMMLARSWNVFGAAASARLGTAAARNASANILIRSCAGSELRDRPADQGRDDPCAENKERADNDVEKILFCFGQLALVPLRGDELEPRDDEKERDDRERHD